MNRIRTRFVRWWQGSQRLQSRLMLALGVVLALTLILVALSVFILVADAESNLWRGRQFEAGRTAASQTTNFIASAIDHISFDLQLSQRLEDPAVLEQVIAHYPSFLELVVVDENGAIVASAAQSEAVLARAITIPQSTWFQQMRGAEAGNVYLGEVQLSAENIPYMILASPTHDGGVVALRLSLNVLGEIVANLSFGETGKTYVAQSTGVIAAHPDPEVVEQFTNLRGRQEFERALAATGDTPPRTVYFNFQNVEVYGTGQVIPNTNLVVITEVEANEASTTSRNTFFLLAGSTFIFYVLVMLATNRVLRTLVFKPLDQLQVGTDAVQKGDLTYQVGISRPDEIGEVTKAFNEMVLNLASHNKERERLIRDLQAARAVAEESSRIKSEFLSTMSHELRTPMNAIEGFTSIMLNKMGGVEYNPQAGTYIERVNANSKRLLALINDFLDLSRVESGRLELANQPFSPATLAQNWVSELSALAENKKIALELKLGEKLPETIVGDAEAISKIAINLIGNAIKFTEKGGVTVSVGATESHWIISVADTGIGIPLHARDLIFEEFRQVDQSSKRNYGGTGLGLAIVQKYARAMRGTVSLQSEVGEGSTFTVTLPLRPATNGNGEVAE